MTEYVTAFEVYLLTQKRVSQNTVSAYLADINQFIHFCIKHKKNIACIGLSDLQEFLKQLHEETLSARSIARKISALKVFFAYMHEKYSYDNYTKHLYFPKIVKTLPKYLSPEEIDMLFIQADRDSSDIGIRNRVMLYLMYASGVRVTELVMLKISDIRFDTGFIVVMGKGSKQRMVPIPQTVLDMISTYLQTTYRCLISDHKYHDYLFPVTYGKKIKPISRQAFWIILKDLWSKTGSTRSISPHQLRHSLATHMLKEGVNLRSLQLILGHENITTLQTYTHLETSHLRTIYDKKHPRS